MDNKGTKEQQDAEAARAKEAARVKEETAKVETQRDPRAWRATQARDDQQGGTAKVETRRDPAGARMPDVVFDAKPKPLSLDDFLAGDKKLSDLSRRELAELAKCSDCPDFLKTSIAGEFASRIR